MAFCLTKKERRAYLDCLKDALREFADRSRCDPASPICPSKVFRELALRHGCTEPSPEESNYATLLRISRHTKIEVYLLWDELLQWRDPIADSDSAFFQTLRFFALSVRFPLDRSSMIICQGIARILRALVKRTYYGNFGVGRTLHPPDLERYRTALDLIPHPSGLSLYFRGCNRLGLSFLPSKKGKLPLQNCMHAAAILGHPDVAHFSELLRAIIDGDLHSLTQILARVGLGGAEQYFQQAFTWTGVQRMVWRASMLGGHRAPIVSVLKQHFPLFETKYYLEFLISSGNADQVRRYLNQAIQDPTTAERIERSGPWILRRIWDLVAAGVIDANVAMRIYDWYRLLDHRDWCEHLLLNGVGDPLCAGIYQKIFEVTYPIPTQLVDLANLSLAQKARNAQVFQFLYHRIITVHRETIAFSGQGAIWAQDLIAKHHHAINPSRVGLGFPSRR